MSGDDREAALAHLAASVGHHVINAFSAVVSNAEILKLSSEEPGEDDEDAGATADVIVKVALRASGVARRLIDYTRPTTNPGTERVDLRALVEEVAGAPEGPAECVVEVADLPAIVGIDHQLRLMLRCLLANAREAVRPEGGRIAVRGLWTEPGWFSLQIEDDGCGMDDRVQERALEPFFSTKAGHVGVGLCLANSIWRRHGGTLSIRSAPGRGTVVQLAYGVPS